MRMSVMGQGRARVGCCSVAGTDCSAPAAILDAFLRLDKKGIVKPGESKKGLEMGILGPVHHSSALWLAARLATVLRDSMVYLIQYTTFTRRDDRLKIPICVPLFWGKVPK